MDGGRESTLITRTQKQHITQNVRNNGNQIISDINTHNVSNQNVKTVRPGVSEPLSLFRVTTTTKTIREVQYIGPDGLPIEFIPGQEGNGYNGHGGGHMDYQNQQFADYQLYQQHPHNYNRPPTPPTPSERSNSPSTNHRGKKFQNSDKSMLDSYSKSDKSM